MRQQSTWRPPSGKQHQTADSWSALRRKRSTSQSLLLLFLLVGLSGCAGSLSLLGPQQVDLEPDELPAFDHVAVTYFGASGFLLRRGDDAILVDPFFSNPGLWRTLMGRIETRPDRVDALLSAVEDINDVDAILVSHSHYDHLMDVAYVALTKATRATRADVYTSRTGTCILDAQFAGADELGRLKAIGDPPCRPGAGQKPLELEQWVDVTPSLRFMPLLSEHAPHFRGRSLYEGSYDQPLGKAPTRAKQYLKGRVFAFVIEFLTVTPGKPRVDFRIYLQGSAANAGEGLPPADLKEFDLAILAAAGHHEVCGYPQGILKWLEPKHLLVSHWENFFASPKKPMKLVRGTDVRKFLDVVEATREELPDLGPSRLLARGSRAVYPVRGAEN